MIPSSMVQELLIIGIFWGCFINKAEVALVGFGSPYFGQRSSLGFIWAVCSPSLISAEHSAHPEAQQMG